LIQIPHYNVAVLDQELLGNLEIAEHLHREACIVSSAFLFCDPAALTDDASLAFGYVPVSRL